MKVTAHYSKSSRLLGLKVKAMGFSAMLRFFLLPFVGMTTGCLESENLSELESDRDYLIRAKERRVNESEKLRKTIAGLEDKAAAAVKIKEETEAALSVRRIKEKEIEEFETRLRVEMGLLKACRDAFKIKIDIEPGEVFGAVKLKDGKELQNVVFKSLGADAIKLAHSGGIGFFPLDQMPDVIAKHIVLPPSKPMSEVDPDSILASKPHIMMSSDQIKKAKRKAYDDRIAAARAKGEKQQEALDLENAKQAREEAAAKAVMAVKQAQIDVLTAEYRKLQLAYKEVQNAQRKQEEIWANMKIRPSTANRRGITEDFNRDKLELTKKISGVEGQILQLKNK